jgi:branched-chain amino acid transport system permease protein
MTEILQFLFSGVMIGSIYALIAVAFCMVYNATESINFAQGEFAMLGGMVAAVLFKQTGWSLPVVILLSIVSATLVGMACERLTIAPLKNPKILNIIIILIGVGIFLKNTVMLVWGKFAMDLPSFSGDSPFEVMGATFLPQGLWIVGITAVIIIAIRLFFERTLTGKAMVASATDREVATMVGINVSFMVFLSFAISSAIGAIAGIILTPITLTSYDHGTLLGLKGFCGAILGGLGNIYGAILGGILLGILESFGAGLISSGYKDAIAFFILILLLFVRPTGILGEKISEKKG